MKRTVFLIAVTFLPSLLHATSLPDPFALKTIQSGGFEIKVQRLPQNPIISYESSTTLGTKINGPSLIKVPDWIENPLGKYYLYFAHHDGKFIRLAYANSIQGPWTAHEPGTLRVENSPAFIGHIASPDIHIDHESKEIRMYFHGSRENQNQKTAIAVSKNGLEFKAPNFVIGSAYFRVFEHSGHHYAIDAHGYLNRSRHYDRDWVVSVRQLITPITVNDQYGNRDDVRIRHSATWVMDDTLFLFYTRKADAPERILMSTVSLQGDWHDWSASSPVEILRPEAEYEGIQFPIKPSKKGGGIKVQQLRDPAIFHDDDDQSYLIYSIAGEMGLATAEISISRISL